MKKFFILWQLTAKLNQTVDTEMIPLELYIIVNYKLSLYKTFKDNIDTLIY